MVRMLRAGWAHNDSHAANVIVLRSGCLALLDFGMATEVGPLTDAQLCTHLRADLQTLLLHMEPAALKPDRMIGWELMVLRIATGRMDGRDLASLEHASYTTFPDLVVARVPVGARRSRNGSVVYTEPDRRVTGSKC